MTQAGIIPKVFTWGVLAAIAPGLAAAQEAPVCLAQPTQPGQQPVLAANRIALALFLASKPQDMPGCTMEVRDGRIQIAPPTSNAAMSCPDMFSWKLFAESVKAEFWKGWATDPQTWPVDPYPLCGPAGPAGACCTPGAANNPGYDDASNPAVHCPYFPGDHLTAQTAPRVLTASPLSKAHLTPFTGPLGRSGMPGVATATAIEPGRKIRQSMAELVFRNKPMLDFVFGKDIYHQQGLQRVFKQNHDYQNASTAPYRRKNAPNVLTEIEFPADTLMIKSDWLAEERAREMGLRDDPANPYVKITIESPVYDNNGVILEKGVHWLVAIHFSSKDIPNWVWTTFEHVHNPGRCDYTGCNDSYGYATPDQVSADQETNYTSPHFQCDNLLLGSWIYDLAKPYPGGTRSQGLAQLFSGLGIGNGSAPPPGPDGTIVPSPADPAWLSYRLKGSQTEFVDATGQPTRLGNSVTEGGFVNTSSCMTCHSRASISAKGSIPPALSVFISETSETGYLQSARGAPGPDWFRASNQPPALAALQTDFVWGFLNANCIASQPNEYCKPQVAAAPALAATAPRPGVLLSTPRAPGVPSIRERVME